MFSLLNTLILLRASDQQLCLFNTKKQTGFYFPTCLKTGGGLVEHILQTSEWPFHRKRVSKNALKWFVIQLPSTEKPPTVPFLTVWQQSITFASLHLTFSSLQGSERTLCEIPLTPLSSCWFHFGSHLLSSRFCFPSVRQPWATDPH